MDDNPIQPGPIDPRSITEAERLIGYLHERDEPCPLCGYNLRNLTSPRCPECGELLRLSVTQAEPYLKAWISLLAATCAGAGIGTLFGIAILIEGPPPFPLVIVATGLLIAMVPVMPFVIWKRRAILKLSHTIQWTLAAVAIGIFLVSMVLFLSGLGH